MLHKKAFFYCTLLILFCNNVQADCFLLKEGDKTLLRQGDCTTRYAPRCTFNIALSLMGFNEKLLITGEYPSYEFQNGYVDYVELWKQPHNPRTWMKNSCVWYSHIITQALGLDKLQYYVQAFGYGSQDVSGDKGKNNALTRSWMSGSSLTISAEEQTKFLQKLLFGGFDISTLAYTMTKNILYIDKLKNDWRLYGKTGTGNLVKPDGSLDETREGGWFVGWIDNGSRTIVFANYIEQDKQATPAGAVAKEATKRRLKNLIENY